MNIKTFTKEWGGRTLKAEVGRYAGHANGSCTLQYGETVVLATACMSSQTRDVDFLPLSVEYEERLYAAGRIKGSRFIKKEGRPTDEAVLSGRFIDRAIRPLFDARVRNEIQVVITVLAFDGENDPDQLGLIAASCALMISDIPWNGPIAVNRVGQIDGAFVLNPTYAQREQSLLDLAVAGTEERVIMVEAAGKEASEELTIEAFAFAQANIKPALDLILEIEKTVGRKKIVIEMADLNERTALIESVRPFVISRIEELFFAVPQASKIERVTAKAKLKKETEAELITRGIENDKIKMVTLGLDEILDNEVTRHILEKDHRVDGRALDEVRPLFAEVAVLPRVHGSGHFMRGETQVLSVVTLGAPGDEQTLDGMEVVGTRRFMHHYNFPPFSVGEAKPMRGPGRREIGHGALAEKALDPMMPSKEDFPYAIRVVSEVFSSNGSSSMGSVCGASLALMDAGVPIKEPIAGIAIGLASTPDMKKWKVITDLQDLEDGNGGMDFKIAGSKNGITAIQLDTKTIGLTHDILVEAIMRGKTARLTILQMMLTAIPAVRADLSPNAPRIVKIMINPDKIRDVIGPGGKMINEIIKTTGVSAIDIEDSGLVMITSVNAEAGKKALDWVKMLTAEPEIGTIYDGTVTRVMDFGAFVEIMPKKEGLVHVSEMAPYRVERVSDIVKVGDKVKVKLFEVDSMGRINLSMKQAPGNVYPEKPAGGSEDSSPRRPPKKPFHH
ncbi:MAG: polyribonucleotide nucleotidyltransferase [Patescibacteria group bacterium]